MEFKDIGQHEPRWIQKQTNKKDVHTDPNYTKLRMWKLPGIRM